jgi:transposase
MRSGEKATGTQCPGCRKLEKRIERLERINADLRKRLEEAERAAKRQAAPFSKGEPKKKPKKPGRKPGAAYGERHSRARPAKIDRVLDALIRESCCPDCGGELGNRRIEEQFVTDIPRVESITTQLNVHCANCLECGRRVQGRHPEQTSDALGAASNQIGPHAIALAIDLNKTAGVSDEKVSRFFGETFGLSVSRSGLRRAYLRAGKKGQPLYENINVIVRDSALVYPDETGWKVGGVLEWLWAFVSPKAKATLYTIEPSRGFDVIDDVLGSDYDGLVGRDGWAPYDSLKAATHGLCNAHLIRRACRLEQLNRGGAVRFPRDLKALLQRGLRLRDRRDEGLVSPERFLDGVYKLEWALDELITKKFSNDENRKLAAHIIDHREAIFGYLYHPELEATNWPAEQAIRPAVVNRKMSGGGNRTRRGARAQAVLTSIIRTARQRGINGVRLLEDLLRSPDPSKFAALALGP